MDGWKLQEVSEVETGKTILIDEHDGEHEMKEVNHEKYLGDILSSDGKNAKNFAAIKSRGHGIVNQIMSMLEGICFGKFYFEVAMTLRESLLISSLLTNSESWYNLTLSDMRELESVDEILLRTVLECPMSTPREMLYLELGVIPIRFQIMIRRLNFLQYILFEDKNSLIHQVLKTQLSHPTFNDWGQTVVNDLEKLDRKLDVSDVENLPVATYQRLVKESALNQALKYLNGLKVKENQQASKTSRIQHRKIGMASYLKPNQISIQEAKFMFTLRSRMLDIKCNYRGKYSDVICPSCKQEDDTQQHLLVCSSLNIDVVVAGSLPDYNDLFSENLSKQVQLSSILKACYDERIKLKNDEMKNL